MLSHSGFCLEIIRGAIEKAGGRINQVTHPGVFLKDTSDRQGVVQAHGEFFSDIRPASTLLAVGAFIRPEWLVEIEADCVVND